MPLHRFFVAVLTILAVAASPAAAEKRAALTADLYFGRVQVAEAGVPAGQPASDEPAVKLKAATTMTDLNALAAAKNWAELHDRLTDISPASRDAHWNSLVEQAALGELAQQTVPGGSSAGQLAALDRYYPKFPSLASSEKFLALRTKIGLEAYSRCFDERRDQFQCRRDFERFVLGGPASAELALGAAHIIGIKFNRQAAAIFYEAGLDAPGGQAVCSDSELQYDLIRGLELPSDYREAKSARAVMAKCWEQVKTEVAANAAKQMGESYFMQNACPALLEHNALTGLLQKRCQAIKQ